MSHCSVLTIFSFITVLVAVLAIIFSLDFFSEYLHIVPNFANIYSGRKETIKLFTKEELKKYIGKDDGPVYLAVLGHVFDVTKGKKHYGPGGGYEFFAGKDGTRGYVTGEFNDKGLIDNISGLTLSQIHSIQHWLDFYQKEYTFIGHVVGNFFDQNDNPTEMKLDYDRQLIDANKEKEDEKADIVRFPPCNTQFKAGHGRKLWCSNYSGGIQRKWVGVPRLYLKPGSSNPRCACVKNFGPPSDNPYAKTHSNIGDLDNPHIKPYEGCPKNADSCSFQENSQRI